MFNYDRTPLKSDLILLRITLLVSLEWRSGYKYRSVFEPWSISDETRRGLVDKKPPGQCKFWGRTSLAKQMASQTVTRTQLLVNNEVSLAKRRLYIKEHGLKHQRAGRVNHNHPAQILINVSSN